METKTTKYIKQVLYKHNVLEKMSVYGCFEVTLRALGYQQNKDRVDFVTIDNTNTIRCYEIKISKSDFHSTANLSFWGNYNYIVVTPTLLDQIQDDDKFHILRACGVGVVVIDDDEHKNEYMTVRAPKLKQVSFSQHAQIVESMMKSLSRELSKSIGQKNEYW